ncbi:hypothetical protein GGX14DRAFT_565695 [Mycena pura]|uniref:Uncharacterized protein n=1 Tax=Mycena pura TaxID=153505 RepID=A0AAD6YFG4_9AGAR|nr:hypothetical protein GGX14DRAFT_565695 [Mycena pura]
MVACPTVLAPTSDAGHRPAHAAHHRPCPLRPHRCGLTPLFNSPPTAYLELQVMKRHSKGMGKGAQGYSKPVNFVCERETKWATPAQTDEELQTEHKEDRCRDEEALFRNRARRYELRERSWILALERTIARQCATAEAKARDRVEIARVARHVG